MAETKRLSTDLDINIHCEIKKIAAIKNITITTWILEAIIEKLKKEKDLGF